MKLQLCVVKGHLNPIIRLNFLTVCATASQEVDGANRRPRMKAVDRDFAEQMHVIQLLRLYVVTIVVPRSLGAVRWVEPFSYGLYHLEEPEYIEQSESEIGRHIRDSKP